MFVCLMSASTCTGVWSASLCVCVSLTAVCSYGVCFNGGQCREGSAQLCHCPAGFSGPICQYGKSISSHVIQSLYIGLFVYCITIIQHCLLHNIVIQHLSCIILIQLFIISIIVIIIIIIIIINNNNNNNNIIITSLFANNNKTVIDYYLFLFNAPVHLTSSCTLYIYN